MLADAIPRQLTYLIFKDAIYKPQIDLLLYQWFILVSLEALIAGGQVTTNLCCLPYYILTVGWAILVPAELPTSRYQKFIEIV